MPAYSYAHADDDKPQRLSKQMYRGKPIWYEEDTHCKYRSHKQERFRFSFMYGFHARCEDCERRIPRKLGISGTAVDAFYAGWDEAERLIKIKFPDDIPNLKSVQ